MAVSINLYNSFKEFIGDGTIDLDNPTAGAFDIRLMTGTHSFNATHTQWSNVSANEITAGNGYAAGGQNLSPTWTRLGGTVTWDAADVSWTDHRPVPHRCTGLAQGGSAAGQCRGAGASAKRA